VTLWNRGDEVYRVTARKDEWGEVESLDDGSTAWICNTCRFDKKKTSDWVIEGPRAVSRHSVISQGHYEGKVGTTRPTEIFNAVHDGRQPKLLMDIHSVSEVNRPEIELSRIAGPSHSSDFQKGNE
jgi:NADH-quinone oxidoreductase subunit G